MLKLINKVLEWLATPSDFYPESIDLLAHPILEAMNERELADLPLADIDDNAANRACVA